MIRALAAIDSRRGLADEQGIPWNLPSDKAYVREKTWGGALFMGYRTYIEFVKPLPGRRNIVLTEGLEPLRDGFEAITDLDAFMKNPPKDLWLFGGAGLFAQTIDFADELYITQLDGDFDCTKFFPEYEEKFELATRSEPHHENGIKFRYEIWKRKR